MTTRAEMIAEIADDLERSDTAAFTSKINNAIRHYQSERFWFNETRTVTFSTVVGQSDYAFVTDITTEFYEIDEATLAQGTNLIPIKPTDYRSLELLLDGSGSNGLPVLRAYVDRTLRLYPKPDQIYVITLAGHIKKDGPAGDDEADNVWMNEGYDLIKSRAKAELLAVRYRDPEGAAIERVAEGDYFSELKGKTAAKIGTGSFRPTAF